MTAAGLPLLAAIALGKGAGRGSVNRTWAARAALCFIVVAVIATVTSATPVLATVGRYLDMTGLIFLVGLVACWALGAVLNRADRHLMETAILVGATLNAAVAILQRFPGLRGAGLPLYGGVQPDGLLGNPVFFGALLAASVALLLPRVIRRPTVWGPVTAAIGFGVGISGQRLPVLVALVIVGWSFWVLHRTGQGFADSSNRSAGLLFGGLAIVPLVIGAVIPGAGTLTRHVATYGATETFGDRFGAWSAGLRALASHPLFGYGPDRFGPATLTHYSLAGASQLAGVPFYDAHNIVVELAVTTGVLGVATMAAWAWFAFRDRGGPLVTFALGLLAYTLVEPLFVGLVPLAFLAVGAAGIRARPDRPEDTPTDAGVPAQPGKATRGTVSGERISVTPPWARRSAVVLASVAVIPALMLLIGDIAQQRAATQPEPSQATAAAGDATTARHLLWPWPEPLTTLALATYAGGTPGDNHAAAAVHWAKAAIAADTANGQLWAILATYQYAAGDTSGARASAEQALRLDPWSTSALDTLGELAVIAHDPATAHSFFTRSLVIDPTQTAIRQFVDGTCTPIAASAFGGPSIGERCKPTG
ncbi:MAG: O-antigen ligase family protein [Acidimicrobiales bacterium]